MPDQTPTNPLDAPEVSEDSISELFALEGEDLIKASQDKLRHIVETVRANRHIWEQEETSSKKAGRRAKPSKGLKLEDLNINLEDLG
jgi:hypothetical protein